MDRVLSHRKPVYQDGPHDIYEQQVYVVHRNFQQCGLLTPHGGTDNACKFFHC